MEQQLDIETILKSFREQIGDQAQIIAILKGTIEQLTKQLETKAESTVTQ
jgi:hypothetical protein